MKTRLTHSLPFLVGLLLFSYSAYRAAVLSITYDEAYSFFFFVKDSFSHIITNELLGMMSANNHVLNTVLVKLLLYVLPLSELTLRLPALLGHILFLFYTWMIVKHAGNLFLAICLFLFININPYLLDFFSLSRGYGLSMGLLAASTYYLLAMLSMPHKAKRNQFLAILFGSLAIIASFSLLNYFAGLLAVIITWQFIKAPARNKWYSVYNLSTLLTSAATVIYVLWMGLKLKGMNALYYGGNTSFWKDTVESLVKQSLYDKSYFSSQVPLLKYTVAIIYIACLMVPVILIIFRHTRLKKIHDFTAIELIISIAAISTIMQHFLFGTLFLIERTGLFMIVLFSILIALSSIRLYQSKKLFILLPLLLSGISIAHFANCFNLHFVLNWKANADVKQMMTDLNKEYKNQFSTSKICLFRPFWENQPPCEFYNILLHNDWIKQPEEVKLVFKEDLSYQPLSRTVELSAKNYKLVHTYPLTGYGLFQRDSLGKHTIIIEKSATDSGGVHLNPAIFRKHLHASEISEGTYGKGLQIPCEAWFNGDTLTFISVSMNLFTQYSQNDIHLLMAMENNAGGISGWTDYRIRFENVEKDKWSKINLSFPMPVIKSKEGHLNIWMQNKDTHPVFTDQFTVKIFD